VVIRFVDIGGIVDHHCLEVAIRFLDIGGIVNHHCLEVVIRFVDIGGIVDHHCLEMAIRFVDIGGIVEHHCLEVAIRFPFHKYIVALPTEGVKRRKCYSHKKIVNTAKLDIPCTHVLGSVKFTRTN